MNVDRFALRLGLVALLGWLAWLSWSNYEATQLAKQAIGHLAFQNAVEACKLAGERGGKPFDYRTIKQGNWYLAGVPSETRPYQVPRLRLRGDGLQCDYNLLTKDAKVEADAAFKASSGD